MIRKALTHLPEPAKSPLRAVQRGFARTASAARRVAGREPPVQLVVCGYPRSGTSLVYNMLSATLPGVRFTEFEESAIHGIQMWGSRASKSPMDILELARLGERNCYRKRVVVLIPLRDPRDIVTSIHPLLPDRYFIGFDHSWWPGKIGSGQWKYDAAGIGEIHAAISAAPGIPGIEVATFRYEDLVADPDGVQARLAAETGLAFHGRFADFHTRGERLAYKYDGRRAPKDASLVREGQAADARRAGKWREPRHRERVREQFAAFPALFDLVREYGYEASDAWFEPYKAAQPDMDSEAIEARG